MSAWKELQLALKADISDEELDEYERTWEYDCRRDYEYDKAIERDGGLHETD